MQAWSRSCFAWSRISNSFGRTLNFFIRHQAFITVGIGRLSLSQDCCQEHPLHVSQYETRTDFTHSGIKAMQALEEASKTNTEYAFEPCLIIAAARYGLGRLESRPALSLIALIDSMYFLLCRINDSLGT